MTKIMTQPHKSCEQRFPNCQSWVFIMHTESIVKPRVILSTISSIRLMRKTNVKKKKSKPLYLNEVFAFWPIHYVNWSNCTSRRCLNILQWFPTALKMTFKFPRIVLNYFPCSIGSVYLSRLMHSLSCSLCLATWLSDNFLNIENLVSDCSCYSLFCNSFSVCFSCLPSSQTIGPNWIPNSLKKPLLTTLSKEGPHPVII